MVHSYYAIAHSIGGVIMPGSTGLPYIAAIVGTRPEIVKLAHIVRLLGPRASLIHTGQHTDEEMSGVFFAAAKLPEPQTLSGIRGEPRHVQIGRMVDELGTLFTQRPPAAGLGQ